jgi:hypothetical protein
MRVEVLSYIGKKSDFSDQNVKSFSGQNLHELKQTSLARSELKSKNLDERKNICFNILNVGVLPSISFNKTPWAENALWSLNHYKLSIRSV